MRKFLRSFVMLALLAVPFVTQAQNTLTVADGTTTNSYVPVYGYWADDYLRCQIVYPASEIENAADVAFMTGGSITSMTFHASTASASWTGTFEVKLMEISGTTISSFQNVASATTVYTGTLAIASNQLVVNFTTPYTYQGGNLLVEVSETTPGNYASSSFYGVTYSGVSLANYNSSGVSSVSATQRDFLPKTTFTFTGGTPLTCPAVTNLAVSNITPTSATLTWTDDINTGATYTIKNGNEVIASGVTGTTYDLPGLTANTDYTFGVMANCSATDNSNTKTVSFTTPCSYEAIPFVETFDASINTNACWAGATGITADEVFAGATLTLGAASQWTYSSSASNGLPAGHYRANIYGTSCKRWLITPAIDLTSAASAQLTFDAAFTVFSSSSNAPASGFESNSSQAFMVLISTDGGQTWLESNATKWQNTGGDYTLASLASSDYIEQTINLNQYLGQTIRIAFYAQSTTSGGDNNIHIDNVVVDVIPTCLKVTNLAVSNITASGATLTWTDALNTGASYSIYNGDELVATVPAGTYTYDITGLEPVTNYTFSVLAKCAADDSSRAASVTFTSACPEYISLPYFNDFNSEPYYSATTYANAFPHCWTRINDATGTYNYYPYNYNSSTYAHSGNAIYFYLSTTASYASNEFAVMPPVDVTVNPMNNNMVEFWAKRSTNAVSLEVGTMSDPTDASTFVLDTAIALTTTHTQYRVKLTDAPATNAYVAFHVARGTSALYVGLDDVLLDTIPAVWPVVAAQFDSATDGSISLSWTPNPENDANITYTLYNGEAAIATGIADTFYTVTGLTANTNYTFAVEAVATNGKRSVQVEVAGRTDCDYNLVLSLPVTMGFEDAELNDLYCWSAIYGSADNATANPMVRAILGEDTVWRFSSYNEASDYNQYLVSPRFNSTEPIKVTFSHQAYNSGDQLRVLYYTANAAGDGDTAIAATDWLSAAEMTADSAYLPATATRVAFQYYGSYAYYYYIDNINLSVAPTHNVTFNYINQEGNSEVWGTAAVDGLAYEGMNAALVSTPGEYKRTAAWYAGTITDTTGLTPLAIDTNNISFGPVMGDTSVTVFYGYGQFRIAATPNQERMGSVEADPASANNMYDYQSEVTLTAVPADGFMFKEWLNADDNSVFGNDNPLTLTAVQNYDLKARFVIDTFTVDYTAIVLYDDNTFEPLATAGTVTGAENGLMFGELATITAEPAEHYEWSHWATSAEDITSLTADQTLNFRMLGDTTFYPVFTPEHYTVTIDGDPARATYTGAGEYAYGDTVTITVSAVDDNYTWMGWMENGETITTDTFYTFVIESNRAFFANIPGGMNTVTFTVNDMDMGSVAIDSVRLEDGTMVDYTDSTTLTVTLNYGSVIYATATPVPQYAQFNGWSHGTADLMATSAAFNVVNDTTITANFGFQTYEVTVNVYPDALVGTVDVNPAAPEYGETVTLTATAADHWVFDHWTDATDATIGTDLTYTSGLLFEDVTYNAYFVRDTHTVVALVEDETYGTTEVTNADAEVAAEFVHGSAATLTFTEGYGYTFAAWVDEDDNVVSTDNPYTIDEVEEDITLTATVDPIVYNVTVLSGEAQRGAASTSTPTVAYLGTADITATPNYGYVFDYWANEAGDEIELPLVITQDTTVVAHFTFDQFTVTGAAHEECIMMGTVAPATGEYDYLSTVTLTATANYGYHFTKWVDAAGNELGTAEEIDIVVESDSNVFAMFDYEPMEVVLDVNDPLMGSAAVTSATAPYFFSQTITIEATPVEHYHFVNWTDATGNEVSTDNPYTFILTEPVNYIANFAIDTHQVTLNYAETNVEDLTLEPTDATAEVFEGNRYIYGTELVATITPAYGFTFNGWSFDGENIVETANTITFTLTQDTTLTPIFTAEQYTITAQVAAGQETMGTVNGTNTVDYLQYVILQAHTNYGYDFVNWTNQDGTVASTDSIFTVQALKDSVLTANFKFHEFTVTIASADDERGEVAWSAPTHMEDQMVTDYDTAANATNTSSYVPFYGYWTDAWQRNQIIYPADKLTVPAGATISSMRFYSTSSCTGWGTRQMAIKLAEVSQNQFSTASAINTTMTTVFATAQVTLLSDGIQIDFDAPYTYNGGNLLVEIDYEKGTYSSRTWRGQTVSGSYGSIYGYSSSSLSAISSWSRTTFLPKVTFTYDHDVQVEVLDPIVGVTYDETDPNHIAYVEYQNSIAMQATANYGYHFIGWTNSLNDDTVAANPMTVASVEADATYTANFDKNQYTITAAVGGDMEGAVVINGADQDTTVDYLETVTLTATPNADHRLLRWVNANDEILGTDTTLTIIAERDSVITAVFGYQVYTLTVNTENFEMGGVYAQDPNDVTPLEATVADGTANSSVVPFDGYNADAAQHNQMIYPASDMNLTAGSTISKMVFYIDQSATNGGNTAADRMGTWTVSLGETTETTLSGLDNTTSVTEVYNGNFDCSTGLLTLEFSTPYTYNGGNLLVDLNHAAASWNRWYFLGISATGASYTRNAQRDFLPKVTFTYTPAPGTVPSLESSFVDVDYTTNVDITATPAEHYHFVGWMNEAGDTVTTLTNAAETITVLGDSTLTALFDGDQMPMTYQVNSTVRGSVEGPATGEFNTEVTFEAIAAHGYQFTSWEDGSNDNPRTVTVAGTDAENTYKAIFDYMTYDVDVTVENGTLADEIDSRDMYYGTQVTLTAVANEHYSNWKGWKDAEGNVVSTANPYTFLVLEDVTLTGVFDIDSVDYTFASNDVTMGTVTSDSAAGRYAYGTEVNLTATAADADHHFVDWNDGETAAERTVVLTQDTDLVANFALNQYNIATNATNGTAVWAGYDYAYPTVNVTINAEDSYGDGWNGNTLNIVKDGSVIDSYTMAGQGVYNTTIYDSYSNSYVADSPITIEWISGGTYSYPDEVSFTINVDGTDVYTISDCSGFTDGQLVYTIAAGTPAMTEVVAEGTTPVDPHTNLTFTATPDAGYSFVNWTDAEGNIVSSANPVIIEIVSDTTLTANFSTEVYTAYAVSTDLVKGTVSPDSANLTVESGALFTATPKYGYVFDNWTDKNGVVLSTDAAFTLTDVTVDSIFANFNYDYFDVTVQANDATYGTVALNSDATVLTGNFPYGDTVNVSATAAEGYYFVNWTDNNGSVVSDQNSARFIVEADVTYTANFADGSEYTITAVADTSVHGQVTGAGTYMAGTTVVLTAVEFPNYFFTQWNDGNTDNPRTINVTANADYIAYYDTVAYTVTVNGVDSLVKYGASFTAMADEDACRTFNGWSNGTDVVASGNQYTFVVTGDIALTGTYSDSITYTAEETVAYCGAYNWNGEDRTATGDYTYTTTTAAGCDSIVTLHLTVSEVMTGTDVQSSCGSFTWIDGITYTESNNTATYTTTASNGCDSVVTLNLTINNPVGTSTTVAQCGTYTWNGTDYATSGTYNYSYTDNNGCIVVDTLVLTVNQPSTETITAAACGSYAWNGETYTASGIYTDTLTNAAGCDSIVTLALTINQPVYTTVNQTACDSFTWTDGNGQVYTTSGTYTTSGIAANGCDSIVTLNLTINQGYTATAEATACDSYNWNGETYTTSGTYTWNGTASNGCDSTVTLTLTVNQSVSETVAETVEENIVWNGVTYTESGTYTWSGTAANGCDSTVTLVLTVTGTQVPDTTYYTVSIETANPGMGTLTGAGTYAEGTIVTLTATPNDGYAFIAWLVNGDTAAVTPEYTFTLVSDTTVTAVFEALPVYYTVTGVANDDAMGYVLGSGQYEAGSTVTLTAQANSGYHFVNWSNGHAEPTITFTVTGDITLTANFEADQPSTGIDESDMENVTIYSAENTIYVRGAEGKDVNVYDINGRTISSTLNAGETVEFRMAATGVYLVKVGNAPAKRVLVVR